MKSQVSIARCHDYQPRLVLEAVRKSIDLIGGITNYVRPGSKVLLKPNLLMAKEPELGITTHPEVVRAVVKLLKEINCEIFIGDGSGVLGNEIVNEDEVYERSGMKRIASEEDVKIARFEKRRWRGDFPLTTWIDECDYFISLPKFKTHGLTILTGAIKNLFGLIPGIYKVELHRRYIVKDEFAKILVDIYEQARPALTVVDAIMAMEGNGPATSGKLRNTGLLLAGFDCLALDSVLALLMRIKPHEILTNREAEKRGLGRADLSSIEILGEKLEDVIDKPFLLPATSYARKRIPRPIINIAKKLIRFYPKVNYKNCILCGACIKGCPAKVINIRNNRIVINYSGCISCFCCQEFCPNAAISAKRSLVARLLRL